MHYEENDEPSCNFEIENKDIYNYKFLCQADLMTGCPPINKSRSFIQEVDSLLNDLGDSYACSSNISDICESQNNEDFNKDQTQENNHHEAEADALSKESLIELKDDKKDICLIKDKPQNNEDSDSDYEFDENMKNTSDSPRQYFLDKRQDVLNKTLMRSLKRYLTQDFFSEFKFKELSVKEKLDNFGAFLKSYVKKHYEHKISQPCSQISIESLAEYVGYMIDAERTRKALKNRTNMKFNKLYYEVVYRYSHQKVSKLFADQTFRFIFEDYIRLGNVYQMIESDKTLSKNKTEYRNTVEIFKHSFEIQKYA